MPDAGVVLESHSGDRPCLANVPRQPDASVPWRQSSWPGLPRDRLRYKRRVVANMRTGSARRTATGRRGGVFASRESTGPEA
jgi:hypothetical protein